MLKYLKEYIDSARNRVKDGESYQRSFMRELANELNKLDALDFEPSKRSDFLFARSQANAIADYSVLSSRHFHEVLATIRELLDSYRGIGSGKARRQFPFLGDHGLREIVDRDYSELRNKLYPDGAWKSAVIMAGSILEAILFDVLTSPRWIEAANSADKGPKGKRGRIEITTGDWKLADLISVAEELELLPKARAVSIDQVLRDYRNFVHPRKEIRSEHPCTECEAMMAVGALDAVCNHLEAILVR